MTYTTSELVSILELHHKWLCGENDGVRANLINVDLRNANLRDANLRDANLRDANLILIGQDTRGYLFLATKNDSGVVVIRAGCRTFVGIEAAKSHWAQRHLGDSVLREDRLSLIERCERMAKARGWKLEPEVSDGSSGSND